MILAYMSELAKGAGLVLGMLVASMVAAGLIVLIVAILDRP